MVAAFWRSVRVVHQETRARSAKSAERLIATRWISVRVWPATLVAIASYGRYTSSTPVARPFDSAITGCRTRTATGEGCRVLSMMRASVPRRQPSGRQPVVHRDGICHAAVVGELDGAVEAEQAQMRDRAVEDRQVGGRPEASTLRRVQPERQVGTAQRRRDHHLLDHGGLGATPVQTELSTGVGVSAHSHGTDRQDRNKAREDVQREQSGTLLSPSATGHAVPSTRTSAGWGHPDTGPMPVASVRSRQC